MQEGPLTQQPHRSLLLPAAFHDYQYTIQGKNKPQIFYRPITRRMPIFKSQQKPGERPSHLQSLRSIGRLKILEVLCFPPQCDAIVI